MHIVDRGSEGISYGIEFRAGCYVIAVRRMDIVPEVAVGVGLVCGGQISPVDDVVRSEVKIE